MTPSPIRLTARRWGTARRARKTHIFQSGLAGNARRFLAFETLEERAMLSVAQDLQNAIGPYQSAINTSLDVANSLPLIGHQLDSLQDISTLLQTTLDDLQQATQGLANGHHQLAISLPTISHTFTFDLGLDALLQVSTSGGVAGSITPTLNIAFDVSGTSATLDAAHTNLDLGFSLTLPDFQATMSLHHLLYTHAVDQGSNFAGHLRFGFNSGGGVSPQFSGDAHINLGLTMSFADPALGVSFNPTFHTNFQLDWGLDTATNKLKTPQIALKNFSLDVDSFTHNFLGDIVTTVQKYTQPLQPFIDIFDTPVPILSAFDSGQTIGDLLLQGSGLSSEQQDRFDLMVKVIKAVNTFDLESSTGAMLDFGDINLTGATLDANGDLLDTFGFDTSQLSGVIDDIFNSPLLDDLQDTLQSVASYTGVTATAGFQFPVLEDPGPVIGAILTGQTRDMFTFTVGRQHFELAPSIGVGIEDVVGVFLKAGIIFDANFSAGYDTAGLVKFAQDSLHRPQDLLHGFYFDNSVDTAAPPVPNVPAPKKTAFYLQGFAELKASAFVTLRGGLYANLNVELAAANTSHVYLDDLITNISSPAKIFVLSGQVYAEGAIELTLPNPVGPNITLFSYELARDVLVDFNPPPPPTETKPLVVIDVTNDHTLELDPAKIGVGGAVSVKAFHDYNVGAYLADGIRVDYAGEIHLYVERKNDVTTNYYNLIGIGGATPDGASIAIIDPFRVFDDEGATDPAPAQTAPGIVLAGGKNVNFRYTEAGDGSQARVLLAGGLGSSTLTGGTMEFGNFIPAARLDQAKQHFGNTTGFDAAGVALVNSSVNAAVAPANPAGIIGSTMTANRGGLMLGGPGANSFIATGAGIYEMIGGAWVDTFNISPSFDGVAATYQIDGGGGDQDSLVARVPANETVTFENAAIDDRYEPQFKALSVSANAGQTALAHGIKRVRVVGAPGSSIVIGDTSLLDIQFTITGSANTVFGGSNAPDYFATSVSWDQFGYYAKKNHFGTPSYFRYQNEVYVPSPSGIVTGERHADPVFHILRTFGTNNKTQIIDFAVHDADSSSITLDGRGASDTFDLTMGVQTFINVSVADSDTTTRNNLSVYLQDDNLELDTLDVTDAHLAMKYYTAATNIGFLYRTPGGMWHSIPTGAPDEEASGNQMTSVLYTPTVGFSSNADVTLYTLEFFKHTNVNLASAASSVKLVADRTVEHFTNPGFGSNASDGVIYPWGGNPYIVLYNDISPVVNVQANAGNFAIRQITAPRISATLNLASNTGTFSIDGVGFTINVLANSGTINLVDGIGLFPSAPDCVLNLGSSAPGTPGSIANIHGTINITSGSTTGYGYLQIHIDDRTNPSPATWVIDKNHVQVGDLTFNSSLQTSTLFCVLDAYWSPAAAVSLVEGGPFSNNFYNGSTAFSIPWTPPENRGNKVGDNVNFSLATFSQAPTGAVTYSAAGLPPGLSLNTSTGLITGTVAANSASNNPYVVVLKVTQGGQSYQVTRNWNIGGNISVFLGFFPPAVAYENEPVSIGPINSSNSAGLPVTFSFTGLPSWLTFNSTTRRLVGTPPAGSANTGPFHVVVQATDGGSVTDASFDLSVSGIKFGTVPSVRLNHLGDSVSVAVPATTTTGQALTYSASGLPAGATINATTGVITGTLTGSHANNKLANVSISVSDGLTQRSTSFLWNVLQAGITNVISYVNPGPQLSHVGDSVFVQFAATTSINGVVLNHFGEGLPAGFTVNNVGYVSGIVTPSMLTGSPYTVTLTATDGSSAKFVTFNWQFVGPQPPDQLGDFDGNHSVDQGDYDVWRGHFGQNVTAYTAGDGNGDGRVDIADYTVWRDHLGQTSGAGSGAGARALESAFAVTESVDDDVTVTLGATRVESLIPIALDATTRQVRRSSGTACRLDAWRHEVDANLILAGRLNRRHLADLRDVDFVRGDVDDSVMEEAFAAFDDVELAVAF